MPSCLSHLVHQADGAEIDSQRTESLAAIVIDIDLEATRRWRSSKRRYAKGKLLISSEANMVNEILPAALLCRK